MKSAITCANRTAATLGLHKYLVMSVQDACAALYQDFQEIKTQCIRTDENESSACELHLLCWDLFPIPGNQISIVFQSFQIAQRSKISLNLS